MVDDLVTLALEDPDRAEVLARRVVDSGVDGPSRASAHQALGIVHRNRGRTDAALPELRSAVRWAELHGDPVLSADVRATYGMTLVIAGRARSGLSQLDLAMRAHPTPLTSMRRASALSLLGRQAEAYAEMTEALHGFQAAGDSVWQARTLHNLGFVELTWGRIDAAETHTREAAALLEGAGLHLESLWARQNLAEVAYARGDLPLSLTILDEVARAYDETGHRRPHLATARCRVYLAAGLVAEAVAVAEQALAGDLQPTDRSVLTLWAAAARLDGQDLVGAGHQAAEARRLLRSHGDTWWETRARLLKVRADVRDGLRGRRLARESRHVADLLDGEHADEAPVALVVASRVAVDEEATRDLLERASAYRTRGPSLVRASGWLGLALHHEWAGNRGAVLRACGRGLDALDEHRRMLGSTELRALATGHGTELAALAVRHAAADPRSLLRWSERWRSTLLTQTPVTPGSRPIVESLAALRDVTRRLAEARVEGEPTEDLEKERGRLERLVRAEHHRLAGGEAEVDRFDVDRLVATVGAGTLVELVDVDGVIHVLVVHGGRVRRYVAGTTGEALALADSARFLLRRSARGRPYAPEDLGARLEQVLLGAAGRRLPDGPVVVVPTARLHGVPWAMLPVLAGRAFTVAPSAAQWLRARAATPATEQVVLLAGPGLGTGGAEVPVLAGRRPDAVHLDGAAATVDAALAALDGARLAHVAAHGRFRADSPLFSALELADGQLTVHDLERLRAAPHRVVLSACESGVLAPVGADELLGLASALFSLGTAGLVCSVAEVNDAVTAELMVDLHGHLDRGADPAAALLALRQATEGDPAAATAAAYVSLGV